MATTNIPANVIEAAAKVEPTIKSRKSNWITGAAFEVHVIQSTDDSGVSIRFTATFDEGQEAERDALVALFPKSNKFVAGSLSGQDDNYYRDLTGNGYKDSHFIRVDKVTGEEIYEDIYGDENFARSRWTLPLVQASIHLHSNGVTGDKNETGYKRLVSILKNLDKNGVSYTQKFSDIVNEQPALADVVASYLAPAVA